MELFGVINTSPDSLAEFSVATTVESGLSRARSLLDDGADGFDIGGQGSTEFAAEVGVEAEWQRIEPVLQAVLELGKPVSVDTWRVDVARRAIDHGAQIMNAADALQADGMAELAAESGLPVILPFITGPDPKNLDRTYTDVERHDPVELMLDWFDAQLQRLAPYGLRDQLILDPGTGFAPGGWEWNRRYAYQKRVYQNLDRLRSRYGLPLYVAVPWKETPDRMELLDIVLGHDIEYARVHSPATVLAHHEVVLADRSQAG